MPEIALQAYEDEIDELVEQARYLEALAHIRHLLSQYPRYVNAYYLLGKTMLEADLPDLAVDMFRRALSADPEHHMARIGLGLAHERRNDLEAAIWNLERALELEPASDEIAEELRRMYGRRDAVDLDYVPQTRGGLARLFLRGRSYGRAVDELRFLLQEEPARPDLMTALAEAYWRNDQFVQASEMCQEILDKMPYNYRANLLLGTLWVNSGQEEGWIYLKRAEEVNPDNQRAVAMFGAESLLEPQAVKLDRLVYDPDVLEVDRDNTWFRRLEAASITVGISEAPPEMTESEVRLVDITASLESQIEIPDWLRDLGTVDEIETADAELGLMADIDLDETADASAVESTELVAEEATGPASTEAWDDFDLDVPELDESEVEIEAKIEAVQEGEEEADLDWLNDLTLAEELAVGETGTTPDWLRELTGDIEAEDEAPAEYELEMAASEAPSPTSDGQEDTSLDWLTALSDDEVAETDDAGPSDAPTVETGESEQADELPDWLAEIQPDDESEAGEIPDWLTALAPVEPSATPVAGEDVGPDGSKSKTTDAEAEEPQFLLDEDDTPDWLLELQGSTKPSDPVDLGIFGDVNGASESEDATDTIESALDVPEWYQDSELQPAPEDEAMDTAEGIPEWLKGLKPATVDTEEDELDDQLTEEELAAWLSLEDIGEEIQAEATLLEEAPAPQEILPEDNRMGDILSGGDALAWLDTLTPDTEEDLEVEAESGAGPIEIAAPEDDEAAEPAQLAAQVEPEPAAEPIEVTPAFDVPKLEGDALSGDDAFDWLEELIDETEEVPPVGRLDPSVDKKEVEAPEAERDMLSGDDALAWLESLTVGKEEELRAQAEAESEARVAEILGRKRETSAPEEPVFADLEPEHKAETAAGAMAVDAPEAKDDTSAGDDALDWLEDFDAVTEAESQVEAEAEPLADVTVIQESEPETDLLSGDDALAWLESLTVGKEEELRVHAEAEAEARVAEILGRKREAPEPEAPVFTEPDSEPVVETALSEPGKADVPDSGLANSSDDVGAEAEIPPSLAPMLMEVGNSVASDEGDADHGEDALAWLKQLTTEEEEALRAQVEDEADEVEPVDSAGIEEAFFGWVAFDGAAEEVISAAPQAAPDAVAAPKTQFVEPQLPEAEAAETPASLEEAPQETQFIEPKLPKPTESVGSVEDVEQELQLVEPRLPEPAETLPPLQASGDEVALIEPKLPETAEARVISAASEARLEELRALVKRKRSDHVSRLELARLLLLADDVSESMQNYARLIRSGAKMDEVIGDLERCAQERPGESSVLRTLGDAFMKFGELDKALELYNRAMNSL